MCALIAKADRQKERGRENDDVDGGDDDDDDEWQKLLPCVWSFVSTLMEFTTQ